MKIARRHDTGPPPCKARFTMRPVVTLVLAMEAAIMHED
jgi:hypothetical protein